ncbi:hypothetical protein EOL94_03310 [bacterium]|nr:hypothetical protein [bacterium]
MSDLNLEKIPELPNKEKPVSHENSNEKGAENNIEQQKESIAKAEAIARAQAEASLKDNSDNDDLGGKNIKEQKARQLKEIDNILSEGLEDVFLNMSPEKQQIFKKTGEEITIKINGLIDKTKVKIDKIVNLIKKWLGLIPDINSYYLTQEAKIKADKILKIKNDKYE